MVFVVGISFATLPLWKQNFCHKSISQICARCSSKPLRKLLTAWNPSDRERTQIHLQNVQGLMKVQNYVTWSIITIFIEKKFFKQREPLFNSLTDLKYIFWTHVCICNFKVWLLIIHKIVDNCWKPIWFIYICGYGVGWAWCCIVCPSSFHPVIKHRIIEGSIHCQLCAGAFQAHCPGISNI